ncbi:OmpW family outer membrane protein [Pelagicoccus sp. SDUM812002]|uniref:OmpW/AlkL family protein n=1 Tax=Pelagicoccus sp. SDUM812002 TaxID=3041266 RepID=UPI00280F05FF|nr:OmpW family outer membrane protein [Pelagicoccus sp. SDUM812002]MDQ8184814.1 OmpW family outer membrane protein [Pelagicoccus sp. SDUM812002]
MKHTTKLGIVALAAFAPIINSAMAAPAKTWEVKVRAAYLETADNSDAFSALGIDFASGAVSVEDKWIPEIDVTFNLTENVLAELVLTIPQKHDVFLAGVGKLGSLEHLPPTLSVVYEFQNESGFVPYVSGGVNFTWITNKRLSVAGIDLDLEDYSAGLALGAGFKYDIDDKWDFDASVKWIDLESDVTVGGARLTTAQLDPLLWSLGASYRF